MGKRSKKKHRQKEAKAAPSPAGKEPGISKRGKKVIAGGIAALVAGFLLLTQTDPRGQNWARLLSPMLILGGYAIVAGGILLPDPGEPSPFAPPPDEGP